MRYGGVVGIGFHFFFFENLMISKYVCIYSMFVCDDYSNVKRPVSVIELSGLSCSHPPQKSGPF